MLLVHGLVQCMFFVRVWFSLSLCLENVNKLMGNTEGLVICQIFFPFLVV